MCTVVYIPRSVNVSVKHVPNIVSSSSRTRVDTAIKWLTDKTKPSNLVMLYFEEPDLTGHKFSPNNKGQMQKAIRYSADKRAQHIGTSFLCFVIISRKG